METDDAKSIICINCTPASSLQTFHWVDSARAFEPTWFATIVSPQTLQELRASIRRGAEDRELRYLKPSPDSPNVYPIIGLQPRERPNNMYACLFFVGLKETVDQLIDQ